MFEEGGSIPAQFTCDGDNKIIPLTFHDIPVAQSLVLIVEDPDIPDAVKQSRGIEVFDHWVLFNINPDINSINDGETPGTQGANSKGENQYTGPCPPDREHRYFFKLYALDTKLDLPEGSTKEKVEQAMQGHIIAEAQLMGKYKRPGM